MKSWANKNKKIISKKINTAVHYMITMMDLHGTKPNQRTKKLPKNWPDKLPNKYSTAVN